MIPFMKEWKWAGQQLQGNWQSSTKTGWGLLDSPQVTSKAESTEMPEFLRQAAFDEFNRCD